MVFTNYGLSGLAITGFTGSGTPPSWLGIGSGSGTIGITTSGIMNEYSDQRVKYTTRDPATQKQVEWT